MIEGLPIPLELQGALKLDYYFMATRFTPASDIIHISVWVVIIDVSEKIHCKKTYHLGHYSDWKELIRQRIQAFLNDLRYKKHKVRKVMEKIQITKEERIFKKTSEQQEHG